MRETQKMTVPYQYGYMLLTHLKAVGVIALLSVLAFLWLLQKDILREMMSVLFILVYALVIYSKSCDMANRDMKPYSRLRPQMKKGFLFGVCIAASIFFMVLLLKLSWKFDSGSDVGAGVVCFVINLLFVFYAAPFYGIMGLSHGMMTWYSYVLFAAVPIVSSTLGYFAGCRGFDILSVLSKVQYEKK